MNGLNLPESLTAQLENPWFRALFTLLAALLIGVALRFLLIPFLRRLTSATTWEIDDEILGRLNPALFQTVFLLGLAAAFRSLVTHPGADHAIGAAALTLVVFVGGRFALEVGVLVTRNLSRQAGRVSWIQARTLPLVQFTYKVVVVGMMAYLVMSAWRIDLTTWLASAGVAGIAIGFAAKDTLANFISGIFILADAPYKVGDYIIIDGVTRGEVTEIGMRSTRLLTRENVEVTVPNAVIGNAKIVNESSGPSPLMRVGVGVGVAYGSDVDRVKEVLLGCTADVAHVSPLKDPTVRFLAMGESSLDFEVRVFVEQPEFRGLVVDALNTRIYKALGEAGIQIPFPQRDVHLKGWEAPRYRPDVRT
ncbi:MAG: mechanosensitive ion channel family protein [Candidatus Krumholzibacteriia bacterium]